MDRIKMCNWPTVEPFQIGIVRNEPQDIIPELTVEYWFRQNNVENHANSRDYFNTVANNKFVSIAEGYTSKNHLSDYIDGDILQLQHMAIMKYIYTHINQEG